MEKIRENINRGFFFLSKFKQSSIRSGSKAVEGMAEAILEIWFLCDPLFTLAMFYLSFKVLFSS